MKIATIFAQIGPDLLVKHDIDFVEAYLIFWAKAGNCNCRCSN